MQQYRTFPREERVVRGTAGFGHRRRCSETWTNDEADLHKHNDNTRHSRQTFIIPSTNRHSTVTMLNETARFRNPSSD